MSEEKTLDGCIEEARLLAQMVKEIETITGKAILTIYFFGASEAKHSEKVTPEIERIEFQLDPVRTSRYCL